MLLARGLHKNLTHADTSKKARAAAMRVNEAAKERACQDLDASSKALGKAKTSSASADAPEQPYRQRVHTVSVPPPSAPRAPALARTPHRQAPACGPPAEQAVALPTPENTTATSTPAAQTNPLPETCYEHSRMQRVLGNNLTIDECMAKGMRTFQPEKELANLIK
jgi:hypothetical protein